MTQKEEEETVRMQEAEEKSEAKGRWVDSTRVHSKVTRHLGEDLMSVLTSE